MNLDIKTGSIAEIRLPKEKKVFWSYVKYFDGRTVSFIQPSRNGNPVHISHGDKIAVSVTDETRRNWFFEAVVKETVIDDVPFFVAEINGELISINSKRRYLRVLASIPVSLWRSEDGLMPSGDEIKAVTESISPGGMSIFLKDGRAFKENDTALIELKNKNDRAEMSAKIVDKKVLQDGSAIISMEYIRIGDLSEAIVTRLVYEYQRMYGVIDIGG